MADDVNRSRTYHSPLRAEQADQTRQRLLTAARQLSSNAGTPGPRCRTLPRPRECPPMSTCRSGARRACWRGMGDCGDGP